MYTNLSSEIHEFVIVLAEDEVHRDTFELLRFSKERVTKTGSLQTYLIEPER